VAVSTTGQGQPFESDPRAQSGLGVSSLGLGHEASEFDASAMPVRFVLAATTAASVSFQQRTREMKIKLKCDGKFADAYGKLLI
jgi:hypothetical protein